MTGEVERIADAVLFEGYVLYPYRASSGKNRMRWQFGVVAPASPSGDGEPSRFETECVVEPGRMPVLHARLRFLHLRTRQIEAGGTTSSWDEGEVRVCDLPVVSLAALPITSETPVVIPGHTDQDRRVAQPLTARVTVRARSAGAYVVVGVAVENLAPWELAFEADRDAMVRRSLVGAHLILEITDGAFVSLREPRPDAKEIVASCRHRHLWPVLAGDSNRRQMLASPIILDDFPAIAPESAGDLFDGTEIDEILSLRILTMTDDEKREARATDPRARQIIDRTEALAPEAIAKLHGTFRSPDRPRSDAAWRVGTRVVLRPSRHADTMDMFLRDQPATVTGVYQTVEDRTYIAVTIDADPAADLHGRVGRFFYFHPDELEVLSPQEAPSL